MSATSSHHESGTPENHLPSNSFLSRMLMDRLITVGLLVGILALGIVAPWLWGQVKNPISEAKVLSIFNQHLPVGTIVPSVLEPRTFAIVAGDSGNFDPRSSSWVPADGRDIAGSEFTKQTGSIRTPDLRGMFLRGLNYTEPNNPRSDGKQDPEGDARKPGDYQVDAFFKHAHPYTGTTDSKEERTDGNTYPHKKDAFPCPKETDPVGGAETRPKNIAVYYYLKIN